MLGGHYVLAGIVISLAATLGSFALLYRLAEPKLGADGARRAVLYLAVFPTALFLQAVYSESLFLVLVLAAFLLAERGRWPAAGAATGLAVLTRIAGVALLPALAVMAWRRPPGERRRALASLCLAPLIFAAYPLYLGTARDDGFAFARSQGFWNRHLSAAGPLGGIWDGSRAAWAGVRQLVSGSHTHYYWSPVRDADPMRVAAVNLEALRVPRPARRADRDRVAALRRSLRSLRSRQPGDPAERAERALAAALDAAVRARRSSRASSRSPRSAAGRGCIPRSSSVSSIMLGVAVTQWALWQWVA